MFFAKPRYCGGRELFCCLWIYLTSRTDFKAAPQKNSGLGKTEKRCNKSSYEVRRAVFINRRREGAGCGLGSDQRKVGVLKSQLKSG